MNRSRVLWILFGLLLLGAVLQVVCYQPQLPERVASRFDAHGNPEGWTTKASFLQVNLGTLALLTGVFVVMWLLLPILPRSLINIPHKEFWLAPALAGYTIALVRDLVLFLGCLTLMLVAALTHLTLRANMTAQPRLGYAPWVLVGVYLLLSLGVALRLTFFFRRTDRQL